MTQAELADRIGVTRQTVIAIEQGRYSPSLEVAFQIARVFGVPPRRRVPVPRPERRHHEGDRSGRVRLRRRARSCATSTAARSGDDEVLVRVRAAGVDPGVWHLMTGLPLPDAASGFGLRGPKVPVRGRDLAGRGRGRRRAGDPVPAGRRGVRHLRERLLRRVRRGPAGPAGAQAGEPHLRAGGGRARLRR